MGSGMFCRYAYEYIHIKNRMTLLKVQERQIKFRVRVQRKIVEKEIRDRGEFRYCSFREVDQVGRGALRRRGQVHAAFWGPGVFLDEKAVRASHLRLLSGWVASARVVYSGQTEAYTFGFAFARACGFRAGTDDLWCAGWAQAGRGWAVIFQGQMAGSRLEEDV